MVSFRSATVIALLESLFFNRLLSYDFFLQYTKAKVYASDSLRLTLMILLINYTAWFFWKTLISPLVYGDFRDIPKVKSFLWLAALAHNPRTELMFQLSQEVPNDGIIALFEIFRHRLLLTNIETTTELLVHRPYDFAKPDNVRKFMSYIVGNGLIVQEGERHKILRKNSLQAFAPRQIQQLYPSIWNKATIFVDTLAKELDLDKATGSHSGILEMTNWAYKAAADIIGIAVLGLGDQDSLRDADSPLIQVYRKATDPKAIFYHILAVWMSFRLVQKLPWKKNEEFRESAAAMKNICLQIVRDKKEALKAKEDDCDEGSSDILSNLIKTGSFSDTELADQLLTYLIAGHDTTQHAFLWTCYLLSKHPKWQGTLREEVKQGLPRSLDANNPGGKVDLDNLEKLPFLNGVINETLRLYPIIPLTTRIAICDTTLGGKHIPKGTEVLVSPWIINRAPESWGDRACEFDPSRWIDDDGRPNTHGKAKSHHDLMTFLHGPRSCIGVHFAKVELRCLVAAMVTRFDWTLGMADSEVITAGVIVITPQGLRLRLRKIDGGAS